MTILRLWSLAELDEVGNAGHGAVFVHDLADDAGGDEAGHAGEVDGGFGLAGADEDSAFAGAEGKDVAGAGEVVGRGVGADRDLDGVGAVGCRDAGGDAFAGLDGLGEGGAEAGGVVLGHGTEAHVVGALFGEGEADEAAAEAGHEVDGFGVQNSAARVRSPSFSRSSSSMRTIMRPALSSARASGMSINPAARSVIGGVYPGYPLPLPGSFPPKVFKGNGLSGQSIPFRACWKFGV